MKNKFALIMFGMLLISLGSALSVRLPTVGGDANTWGNTLNSWLLVSHNANGSINATTNATFNEHVVMKKNSTTLGNSSIGGSLYVGGDKVVRTADKVICRSGSGYSTAQCDVVCLKSDVSCTTEFQNLIDHNTSIYVRGGEYPFVLFNNYNSDYRGNINIFHDNVKIIFAEDAFIKSSYPSNNADDLAAISIFNASNVYIENPQIIGNSTCGGSANCAGIYVGDSHNVTIVKPSVTKVKGFGIFINNFNGKTELITVDGAYVRGEGIKDAIGGGSIDGIKKFTHITVKNSYVMQTNDQGTAGDGINFVGGEAISIHNNDVFGNLVFGFEYPTIFSSITDNEVYPRNGGTVTYLGSINDSSLSNLITNNIVHDGYTLMKDNRSTLSNNKFYNSSNTNIIYENHNIITNNDFEINSANYNLDIRGNDNQIYNNKIIDGSRAINIRGKRNNIGYNRIHGITQSGYTIAIKDESGEDNTIINNIFYFEACSTIRSGIFLEHSNNTVVKDNIFYNKAPNIDKMVKLSGTVTNLTYEDNVIYFNSTNDIGFTGGASANNNYFDNYIYGALPNCQSNNVFKNQVIKNGTGSSYWLNSCIGGTWYSVELS